MTGIGQQFGEFAFLLNDVVCAVGGGSRVVIGHVEQQALHFEQRHKDPRQMPVVERVHLMIILGRGHAERVIARRVAYGWQQNATRINGLGNLGPRAVGLQVKFRF